MTAGIQRDRMQDLLVPFALDLSDDLAGKLCLYLDLLVRWNEKTNLTAVRDPEQMVLRHFGESLFASRFLPDEPGTLLDFGSGAGFPGLPIALVRPCWRVTLAESQGKKVAFLREAIRVLGIQVEVWPRRAELLPVTRLFDVVTLRAVDEPDSALQLARTRARSGGMVLQLTTGNGDAGEHRIPGSHRRVVKIELVG